MKRRILLLMLGLLALGSVAVRSSAQVGVASEVTVTATGAFVSDYMFRGLRLSGAGFQPAVEVAACNLVLGAWSNLPFDGDKVPDSSDPEVDLYGSYTMTIGKDVTFAPGFTAYLFPSAPTSAGYYRTTFEPNVALSFVLDGVKLIPKLYYDMVLKGFTYELTALYALPLKAIGSELDFTGTYGSYKWTEATNDASPDVTAGGDYWLVGVAMPFQISAKSRVSMGVAYTEGRKAYTEAGSLGRTPNPLAVGRWVGTVSYSLAF
jgi:uncharacterized protein (TIGR02001 family)